MHVAREGQCRIIGKAVPVVGDGHHTVVEQGKVDVVAQSGKGGLRAKSLLQLAFQIGQDGLGRFTAGDIHRVKIVQGVQAVRKKKIHRIPVVPAVHHQVTAETSRGGCVVVIPQGCGSAVAVIRAAVPVEMQLVQYGRGPIFLDGEFTIHAIIKYIVVHVVGRNRGGGSRLHGHLDGIGQISRPGVGSVGDGDGQFPAGAVYIVKLFKIDLVVSVVDGKQHHGIVTDGKGQHVIAGNGKETGHLAHGQRRPGIGGGQQGPCIVHPLDAGHVTREAAVVIRNSGHGKPPVPGQLEIDAVAIYRKYGIRTKGRGKLGLEIPINIRIFFSEQHQMAVIQRVHTV